jgi:hypothetical protein
MDDKTARTARTPDTTSIMTEDDDVMNGLAGVNETSSISNNKHTELCSTLSTNPSDHQYPPTN